MFYIIPGNGLNQTRRHRRHRHRRRHRRHAGSCGSLSAHHLDTPVAVCRLHIPPVSSMRPGPEALLEAGLSAPFSADLIVKIVTVAWAVFGNVRLPSLAGRWPNLESVPPRAYQ